MRARHRGRRGPLRFLALGPLRPALTRRDAARRWRRHDASLASLDPRDRASRRGRIALTAAGPATRARAPADLACGHASAGDDMRRTAPSAAAVAYMDGKQALVGLHAPSTKPVERDASGRPMLALTTINRGESLDGRRRRRRRRLRRRPTSIAWPTCCGPRAATSTPSTRGRWPSCTASRRTSASPRSASCRATAFRSRGRTRTTARAARWISSCRASPTKRWPASRASSGFVGVGVYPDEPVRARRRSAAKLLLGRLQRPAHEEQASRGILPDVAAQSDAAALARGQTPSSPSSSSTDVDAALRARGAPRRAGAVGRRRRRRRLDGSGTAMDAGRRCSSCARSACSRPRG